MHYDYQLQPSFFTLLHDPRDNYIHIQFIHNLNIYIIIYTYMIDIIPLLWARIDNRYYIHQTRVLTLSLDVKSHASVQHLIPSPGLSNTRSLAHNFKISHYPPHAQPSSQTPSNLTISANHVTDATEALVRPNSSPFLPSFFPPLLLFRSRKRHF